MVVYVGEDLRRRVYGGGVGRGVGDVGGEYFEGKCGGRGECVDVIVVDVIVFE